MGKTSKGFAILICKEGQEMIGDQENIITAITQRRQDDRHNMQTIEEVFAKTSRLHFRHWVTIGRTNYPHIGGMHHVITNPLHAALLQEAQQLRLQRQVHFANFIQKQSAAIGAQCRTLSVTGRTGKGTFHMAKNFAL